MSNLNKLLSSYSSRTAAVEAPKVRPPYKHALHDSLQAIWEEKCSNCIAEVKVASEGTESEAQDGDSVLGLLFIIIDKLPFENVWRMWIEECSVRYQGRVRVWIHAKFPKRVTSAWVQQHLVKTFQLRPEWGSLELTDVMIRMLKEATEDDSGALNPTHFVYLSESCVPITSLDKAMREVSLGGSSDQSWLNYSTTSTNGYAQQGQFDILKGVIPAQCLMKADQWIMLSRRHARAVLSLPEKLTSPVLHLFKKVRASDEMYFPCCLAILGCISTGVPNVVFGKSSSGATADSKSDLILRRPVTWCDWTDKGKNPKSYSGLTEAHIISALEKGCLFFRKVKLDDGDEANETRFAKAWVRSVLGKSVAGDYICKLDDAAVEEKVLQILSERKVFSEREDNDRGGDNQQHQGQQYQYGYGRSAYSHRGGREYGVGYDGGGRDEAAYDIGKAEGGEYRGRYSGGDRDRYHGQGPSVFYRPKDRSRSRDRDNERRPL